MKLKHLSIVLTMLISGFISTSVNAQQKTSVIKEGVGIGKLKVGVSTKKDVEKEFGKKYKWITNKKYSYQMTYANGVTFYICQADIRQEIFDIEIRSPFQGKTSRGITLRQSTIEDVKKIYGTAKKGLRYQGIEFYYQKIGGKNVVTVIDVVEKSGLRQCAENK